MLQEIAELNREKKIWILKEQIDSSFSLNFPETTRLQKKSWSNIKVEDLRKRIQDAQISKKRTPSASQSNINMPVQNKNSRNPTPIKMLSREELVEVYGGSTYLEQLGAFLTQLFKEYGVCDLQFIQKKLKEREKDSHPQNLLTERLTDYEKQQSHQDIENLLNKMALSVRGTYCMSHSLHPEIPDDFRNAVINKYLQKISWKRADLQKELQAQLHTAIPAKYLNSILKELTYHPKSDPQTKIWKKGDGL